MLPTYYLSDTLFVLKHITYVFWNLNLIHDSTQFLTLVTEQQINVRIIKVTTTHFQRPETTKFRSYWYLFRGGIEPAKQPFFCQSFMSHSWAKASPHPSKWYFRAPPRTSHCSVGPNHLVTSFWTGLGLGFGRPSAGTHYVDTFAQPLFYIRLTVLKQPYKIE